MSAAARIARAQPAPLAQLRDRHVERRFVAAVGIGPSGLHLD